ncbi:MAG: bifunctional UDP-N-acetylglucosamine diphosphorylase/glucosamine-1-phosphate N-acetyltransferase GlmU [Candidatus Sumerlaeaceae bacterium]|nr:bifunctional UDP-N-acetylglucosamine diphosphorylase/glucosamine-1-phosphate N-acetyltransferase GlmU [Candidatus Sumerlaeaceae bacterium]
MKDLVAVILAAGQGSRMYSGLPKVLHSVAGQPMLDHVLESIEALEPERIIVVTGFMSEKVREHCGKRAVCVNQDRRLGTAHAVRQAIPHLNKFKGDVLVTVGDTPLIQTETLKELIKRRRAHQVAATVLTTELDNPTGYGRVVRNRDGTVRKIVEEKDTNVYEAAIKEINTGIYVFDCQKMLEALRRVGNKNAQKEYYLTDTIEILGRLNDEVEAMVADDPTEIIGVNSRGDLARAEAFLRRRIAAAVMEQGVTVIDPATTYIDKQVQIGRDSVIQPFTILQGRCKIGEACEIGPHAHVRDSVIGSGSNFRYCTIEEAEVGDNVSVGPYANIRPGTRVGSDARIGTFVEVTRSSVGDSTDILHLSYIGDAEIGNRASLGTGSVTVNYDGKRKLPTKIGDDVFLGTNTKLVAPVEVVAGTRVAHDEILTGKIGSVSPSASGTSKTKARAARKRR